MPLLLLTAVLAVDQADRYLLSSVFPLLKDDFGLSDGQLGSLSAAFLLVATAGSLPFGILVDRTIRTKVAAWGAALWSVAMLATGLATSYSGLFLSRMGLGVAESSYTPASFSLLTDYYSVEERSRVLGIYQVGSVLGFLGLPIGGLIATHWGWRAAFDIYALVGFVVALLVWRLPEPQRGLADGLRAVVASTQPRSPFAIMPAVAAFRYVLRIPSVTISLLTNALAVFFTSGLGIWATTFLVRYHHLSLTKATAATSLLAVGAIVGMIWGGRLGDRLVARGRPAGRVEVAAVAQMVGVLLLVPAFAVHSTVAMLVLFALGAVTLTMPNAPLAALRADVVHPDLRGRAAAVQAVLYALAAAASPLVIGLISDAIGLRGALLVILPFMGVGGVLLAVFGPPGVEPDRRRMQASLVEAEV
ncbi:MAG: transporter, Spinster family, sphingosine-phosphate transporter [Frankiaceae bacterium]|jgi:MFS family permease|nr:transporter, Spinster family, sphingosine-phosphate transporter [Frankiaceae bacterium]